jgi:hypothetical protein
MIRHKGQRVAVFRGKEEFEISDLKSFIRFHGCVAG